MATVLVAEARQSRGVEQLRGGLLPFWLEDTQALHTAFVSLSRLTGKPMRQCWLALAGVGDGSGDLYGFTVKTLAQTVFPGRSLQDIQAKHTVLPVLTAALTKQRADELYVQMRNAPKVSAIRSLIPTWRTRGGLSCCVECARQEQDIRGIAAWWVSHQLPFLDVCMEHHVALSTVCDGCGALLANGKTSYLPGESCRSCGMIPTRKAVVLEPGALRVFEHLRHLLTTGELEFLRPEHWRRLVHGAIDVLGGEAEAVRQVASAVKDRWPDCGKSICASADLELSAGFVERQLQLQARSNELLGMLVVHGALEALLGDTEVRYLKDRPLPDRANALKEIELIASRFDLPMGLATLLENDPAFETMVAFARSHWRRIVEFVAALPDGARARFDKRSKRDLAECKKLLLRWKKAGGDGRPNVEPLAYVVRRLRVEDPEWLDEHLPIRFSTAATEEKRARLRAQVVENFGNRERVSSEEILANPAAAWLYSFDRGWLVQNVAIRIREASRKPVRHLRREHRKIVRDTLEASPQMTRTELARKLKVAYAWLRVNDAAWLDGVIPSRQGNRRHARESTQA